MEDVDVSCFMIFCPVACLFSQPAQLSQMHKAECTGTEVK